MDVIELLKRMFPTPKLPQKRYLFVIGFALYCALKFYVAHTPDTSDDDWPDILKGAVVEMYSRSGDDELRFGEGD